MRRYYVGVPETTPLPPRALVGRRLIGLTVDWVLCLLISAAFFPAPAFDPQLATTFERVLLAGHPMATLAVFAAQHLLLVATLGTTIGHRLVGVRVVREDGVAYVGVLKSLARTVLLLLILPAVVWDEENRGLHDRGAGTRIVALKGVENA